MIPRTIHFVWIGPEMPEWGRRNILEFRRLNPDHEVRVHGEEVLLPCYRALYDSLAEPGEKCDLLRYSVLEEFGGWYFDVDFWPFRPLAEAESAWRLDGSRLFLAEQSTPDKRDWLNGACLAVGPGWSGWPLLREMVLGTSHAGWGTFGPRMVTRFARAHAPLVEIAGRAWWYGPGTQWAGKLYRCAVAGRMETIRRFLPDTGGQLPFAMHLWAYKHSDKIAADGGNEQRVALLCDRPEWFDGQQAIFDGIEQGLSSLGFRVDRVLRERGALAKAADIPDLLVVWNGVRQTEGEIVSAARRLGVQVILLEHGFWQRNRYVQVDTEGTQHRASWAQRLREPAPTVGVERLARFYPDGVSPMRPRRKGYVLVLGQVPRDSQLWDSEIQGPLPLQRAVKAALPTGVPVCFRPHPQCSNVRLPAHKRILPTLADDPSEAQAYRTSKAGTGLAAALANARFVVTINSTAGNEALAAGVPLLAFGPALYTMAGVARQTTVKTLKEDLAAMLNGWVPEQAAVENYLQWLAARQWTAEELARGDALRDIVSACSVPAQADGPQDARGENVA